MLFGSPIFAFPQREYFNAMCPDHVEPVLSIYAHIRVLAIDITDRPSLLVRKAPSRIHRPMPNPLRLCFAFALSTTALLGQSYSHGTAIAAVRTEQNIFIATDSRSVGANGERHPDTCKIRVAGHYVFSVHGVGDPDILDVIRSVLLRPETLAMKMMLIRDRIGVTVTKRMRGQSQVTSLATGVLVFEEGTLNFAYIRFPVPTPTIPNPEASIRQCPGADCPHGRVALSASPYGDVVPVDSRSLQDVRRFVLDQIAKSDLIAKRDHSVAVVAGPIQSMVLDYGRGHEWHDQPTVCADQK